MQVRTRDRLLNFEIANVHIREVGFGADTGYELAWSDRDGTHAVHVLHPNSVTDLRATALGAAPQFEALSRDSRKRSIGRRIGWLVLLTISALPLLGLAVLVLNADRVAHAIARRIPIEHEVALGNAAFDSLLPSLTLLESGPALHAVRQLGSRLARGSKFTYRFHVAEDGSVNAFALPGGIIVVHSGLIGATRTPEELAGVLAHEIEHVEQRHSVHAAVKELGLRAVWMWITGDLTEGLGARAALELTLRKFSRDAERSADMGALEALVRNDIDPRGLVTFFTTIAQRREGEMLQFLSAHPADSARQRLLRARLSELGERTFPPIDVRPWPPRGAAG